MRKIDLSIENTNICVNESYEAERLEFKIQKMVDAKEPIGSEVTPMYTERRDGVLPQYDVRTDRFEIALEAMDKISKSEIAKREERHKEKVDGIGKTEPTQATE